MQTQAVLTQADQQINKIMAEIVSGLHPTYGGGLVSPSAYDTAWVARIRNPSVPDSLAFPQALEWLLAEQAADGSWGEYHPYTLLPTLAALLAILTAPGQSEKTRKAALLARSYLQEALLVWNLDEFEICGFEVLVPALLTELQKIGLIFNFPGQTRLRQLYSQKISLAGSGRLYTGQSNLLYSLEAFGKSLDWLKLKQFQARDGSYGCSPASTAAALIYGQWDEKAFNWLGQLVQRQGGAVSNIYPIDNFELSWCLNTLLEAGFELPRLVDWSEMVRWLAASFNSKGAGCSTNDGLPGDSDVTAVVFKLLQRAGLAPSLDTLLRFEREKHFACYETERDPSIGANSHVLAALLELPDAKQSKLTGSIHKLITFLLDSRSVEGFWLDKWHVSPYYATACACQALAKYPGGRLRTEIKTSLEWVLRTQRENGGWGSGQTAIAEETAYGLQILQLFGGDRADWPLKTATKRGQEYLRQQIGDNFNWGKLPRLWRGKELYLPERVAAITILVAGRE